MENDPLLTPAPPKDMEFSICFVVIFLKASLTFMETFLTSNHNQSQSPVSKVSKTGCNISVGQKRARILQIQDKSK